MMKRFIFITTMFFFWTCQVIYAGDAVSNYINQMSLRQKVGQLFLLGFKVKDLDADSIAHMKQLSPGGIVFYRRNFEDASDIMPLISKINHCIPGTLPVFFAVDQEGWIVHRIGGELYTPPSAPAIGAANSEKLAGEVGLALGRALRELGINMNLAPVLDVLDISKDVNNPFMAMRSFSDNFRTVEALGTSYIKGLKESGIMATAKHFPGMGRAEADAHYKLPRIKWNKVIDKERDFLPFRGAINAGVDLIMTGHFIAEPGDSVNPVSVSSYWMTDVLRKEMGFKGLIIVDNIEMKSITDVMPVSKAAVNAFKAGADIIMVSHERKNQKAAYQALLNAVHKREISMKRLNQSLRRIIAAKMKISAFKTLPNPDNNLYMLSGLVAEHAVVDIRSIDGSLNEINIQDKILYAGDNLHLSKAIEKTFKDSEFLSIPLSQYEKSKPQTRIRPFIEKFNAVIINARYPDAFDLVSICNELNVKYVVVLDHPVYALKTIMAFKPKRLVITFENSSIHLRTAAEIIGGIKKAKGRLPYHFDLPVHYIYDPEDKT